MEIAEKGVSDAKLNKYPIFAEYVENHGVDIYVDYRDELNNSQIDMILDGKIEDVRDEIVENYYMNMERDDYYWQEMADELEVDIEEINDWLSDEGFWPSVGLSDYDWKRILRNTSVHVSATMWNAEFRFDNWAYGRPIEYEDVKGALKVLGINPAEFKALRSGGSRTSGDGQFKGYFPKMPNRVSAVKVSELYDNMCVLYNGVLNFCLGDLEEVSEVLNSDSKYITFKSGTNIVMYDFMNGAGITEVELTKDVTVKRSEVEFRNDGNNRYGVQECYGFVDSYWKEGGVRNGK